MKAPQYIRWFVKEFDIQLSDGTLLPCYRLEHTEDEDVLNEWAIHLRRHYESDKSLADSISALGLTYGFVMIPAQYRRDWPRKSRSIQGL